MTLVPIARRVFGDGPFAEIGEPALAVVDERSRTVAVGGDLGHVQWSGSGTADSRWTGHRIGIYEQDGLRCRHLVRSWYPVRSLAFHSVLPLLAVGTGRYDGGYSFEGELLLIHLDSGDVVSTLQYPREVFSVEWRSETALRLVLAPCDDWENPQAHEQGHAVVVARSDWRAVGQGTIRAQELAAPAEPVVQPDHSAEARRILADLAASAGRRWSVRRRVWAVEGMEDGRVLAALDGVLAESWLPSGDLQWAVEDEEGGKQLVLASDGTSVWTNAERRSRRKGRRWETSAPRLARIAVDTGQVLETLSPGVFTVLVAGDQRTILRPLGGRRKRPERLLMFDLDGPVNGPEVGAFDLFNHPFAVRRASRPYVLVGTDPDKPHRDKWVTALGADGTLRRLFQHSWVPEEHHFGGPAVEIGQSLVYLRRRSPRSRAPTRWRLRRAAIPKQHSAVAVPHRSSRHRPRHRRGHCLRGRQLRRPDSTGRRRRLGAMAHRARGRRSTDHRTVPRCRAPRTLAHRDRRWPDPGVPASAVTPRREGSLALRSSHV